MGQGQWDVEGLSEPAFQGVGVCAHEDMCVRTCVCVCMCVYVCVEGTAEEGQYDPSQIQGPTQQVLERSGCETQDAAFGGVRGCPLICDVCSG